MIEFLTGVMTGVIIVIAYKIVYPTVDMVIVEGYEKGIKALHTLADRYDNGVSTINKLAELLDDNMMCLETRIDELEEQVRFSSCDTVRDGEFESNEKRKRLAYPVNRGKHEKNSKNKDT